MSASARPHAPSGVADTLLAAGITVFERGWLSANNILLQGDGPTALVDSGYASHAPQTVALIEHSLGAQPLDLLLNTHLHSDHCGGNAALSGQYPGLQVLIPPGQAEAVRRWDEDALTYRPTGQHCPRFTAHGTLRPGTQIRLGSGLWDIHGAKGHDPHSIVLHQPEHRLLISADALWQNGFGVVFPELEGVAAFEEVAETLDLIEDLAPTTVIPGHGAVFQDTGPALSRARSRLEQFARAPDKHHRYGMKVLIKFRLLEWQRIERDALQHWAANTPYLRASMPDAPEDAVRWLDDMLAELERSGALERQDTAIINR